MSRRSIMLGTAAIITMASASPAMADLDTVRWQVPMAFPSSLTALGDTMPWLAEHLDTISGGTIQMRVFEPGALIPALSIFENVSEGTVPAGYSWMGYEWGQVPAAALFGSVPFGMESPEFTAWMYHHGGEELLHDVFEPLNVHPIFCGSISPEAAGWFRDEVNSVDDLRGLRFRAAGLGGEVMAEFGMSVTILPGAELYQALETGVLDATEFSLPTVDMQLGFQEVAGYYYLPGWHQPSTNQYLYVNLDVWNDLNGQTQALIESACRAAVAESLAKAEALQGAALKQFEDEGTELRTYNTEMLDAFWDATQAVMANYSESDEMFARVYDSQLEFQREHAPWKNLGYIPRSWYHETLAD